MIIKTLIKTSEYHDSVSLMLVARELSKLEGVRDAAVVMGTEANKSILADADPRMRDLMEWHFAEEIELTSEDVKLYASAFSVSQDHEQAPSFSSAHRTIGPLA